MKLRFTPTDKGEIIEIPEDTVIEEATFMLPPQLVKEEDLK